MLQRRKVFANTFFRSENIEKNILRRKRIQEKKCFARINFFKEKN